MKFQVFILVALIFASTRAHPHHNDQHNEEDDEIEVAKDEIEDIETTDTAQSRHHTPAVNQATYPATAAFLMPYPIYRSIPQPYPAPGLQVVPFIPEDQLARLGAGGGVSGNLGPISAGVGAGAGTGGLGGGFNFGLPGTGLGVNANAGFTPSYSPGYAHYYNQHYTPTTYYTYSPPAAYYPTATNYGAQQTAAPYLARAVPHFYRQPAPLLF